ncbi:MAG: alpha-ketoglutarate-dependent dioxygenase AlkB, partial [Alphaproteobacteria bacterium]|nr:alpha-ketoglutarate-dependent dioxygenase AlkB [Alphaproteobacteria bacterium]
MIRCPLPLVDADVDLVRGAMLPQPSVAILETLMHTSPWRQDEIKMFGRQVRQPRLHTWYGDPEAHYTYSGLHNVPLPWTPLLAALRAYAEKLCDAPFNAVLLNLYRDGQDSMGMHADDEPELGPEPVIAS